MPPSPITNVDERYAFQITRTNPVSVMGTVNTAVFAFDAAAVAKWGMVYNMGTTGARPTEGSGTWVNVINSATLGTTIKFCKRGMYEFHCAINVPSSEETSPLAVAALILDSSAASMLVATAILPTTLNATGAPGVIDWGLGQQGLQAYTIKLTGTVPITDTLAGGAQPEVVAGATGSGCVRLHINDGAGGGFSSAALICSLWCNRIGDCAG